jgi:hypothetical protein
VLVEVAVFVPVTVSVPLAVDVLVAVAVNVAVAIDAAADSLDPPKISASLGLPCAKAAPVTNVAETATPTKPR